MNYLILDTNIWVYLANGYNSSTNKHSNEVQSSLLGKLLEYVDSGEIKLIVNDIIIEEWDRNKSAKAEQIDRFEKKIDSNANHIKSIKEFLSKEDLGSLHVIHEHYIEAIKKKIAECQYHIDQVEELLKSKSTIITVSDEIKKQITDFAFRKKAPFHRNKNNFADAAIIFSTVDYLADKVDGFQHNSIFVSNNTEDFCVSKTDHTIHPDLIETFESVNLQFETHLGSALSLSKKLTDDLREILSEIEDNTIQCQSIFCKSLDMSFASTVLLNESFEVIRENETIYDPNQLCLNVGEENKPKEKEKQFLISGDCALCNVTHIVCPICDSIFTLDDEDDIHCINCGAELERIEKNGHTVFKLTEP